MGTTLNKKTYAKMIDENIAEMEKYMPDSLEKRHAIDVLKWSINALYEGEGLLTHPKIPKWIEGKPDIEHTCLMMVKVYSNDKFLWDEYIVGRIDETGGVVFMNDESTGWEQDAIECWMEIPKGATAVEAVTPINTNANGA